MRNKNKGFTLIEMLVVITVIGLLAALILVGLSSFRTRGRDTRRIADLKEVQNGLEVYYMKNGVYPDVGSWEELETALRGAGAGNSIPRDPVNTDPYLYRYCTNGQSYVLGAQLEDAGANQKLLDGDIDDATSYCNTPISCTDPVYCIGM